MLEYVVLGDFQTAVAFLLASAPEPSVRYYRDVVCTMVLAASATRSNKASPPSLLHIQVGSASSHVTLTVSMHCHLLAVHHRQLCGY